MGLNCGCPAGKHLADLAISDCKESLGQIQKVLFQRIYKADGTKNVIPDFSKKSAISTLTSSSDSAKILVSPYIQNPTTEPGAARTFGGGNASLGGVEVIIGREPTTFSAIMYQEAQSTIAALKTLMCENIGVYLIDEYGNIGALVDEDGAYMPIPIGKLFVGDKKLGGFEEPDSNTIEWSFFPNWSDNLVIVKYEPNATAEADKWDYNPLTDLVNSPSVSA